jgi:hypothetical protein
VVSPHGDFIVGLLSSCEWEDLFDITLSRVRYVKYVKRWIRLSKEKPLGPVKHMFARFEFQSGQGCGNLPHMHMGLTLDNEPEEATNERVSCHQQWMFSSLGQDTPGE